MYHSTLVADDKEPASAPRAKVVLCLGTFGERKGQVHLAAAFASIAKRHPDWTLQLIGRQDHADYVGKVKAIADGAVANGQIQLLPPALEARPLLQSSSIFAMPSTAEGLGLSLQEALYHGCACVGSAVGGIPELIENEKTGLLVLPGDEAALAAALDRLMSDGDLRARVAKSGRASIIEKGMLAGLMVERHARLYESILAGGNLPAMPG
jgi:glycosyltransferase involved in cell wall biosynthesis